MSNDTPTSANDAWDKHIDRVLGELFRLYKTVIEPLEVKYAYDQFRPSWFSETIVQKKPFITFLGPFSAGKSTFINYLMQSNLLLTGPQPVTDKFTVIMYGDEMQQLPGRVLVADTNQPFRGLNQFGDAFLESFNAVLAPHPILRSVSLIDTPGVLEAAGDVHKRRYDYVKVCRWFVEKSDLVFVMFDPTKLDAGPELRMLFKHALRGFESKIRIVLNKADTVGPQELMRVYGALFWNLSNLINTTEPPRVYVSSFWDQPYKPGTNHELFTDEKSDLLYDLTDVVPLQSLDKRVTTVLKRAQDVLIHSIVCGTLRSRMPMLFGVDKAKKDEIAKLPSTCEDLAQRYRLSVNDFASPDDYEHFFARNDLLAMPELKDVEKKKLISNLRALIDQQLPQLLMPIKQGTVVDPRDRKHAIMVQRQYSDGLSRQLQGERGAQGSLGEMAAPAFRASTLPNATTMRPPQPMEQQQTPQSNDMLQMMMAMQQMQQQSQQQSNPMMMMMMQMMQQQQLQQQQQQQQQYMQQQQPQPQQQQQQPQMTPEQMMMMMQMMQQQQQSR